MSKQTLVPARRIKAILKVTRRIHGKYKQNSLLVL
jgi:hypothetical protein